jgi:ABC-type glutathione transport system ATPase component
VPALAGLARARLRPRRGAAAREDGIAVVYATHDASVTAEVDTVLAMADGRLVDAAPPGRRRG